MVVCVFMCDFESFIVDGMSVASRILTTIYLSNAFIERDNAFQQMGDSLFLCKFSCYD